MRIRPASITDLIVPPACAGCGLPGGGICASCRCGIARPGAVGCARCGHPWAVATPRCAECPAALAGLRFAAPYAGCLPAVIGALKDAPRRALAHDLAALIAERCPPPPAGATLVPVPAAPARRRARGFNQAEVIARALGRAWGLPVADVMVRVRDDPAQRGSARTERIANVRRSFAMRAGAGVPDAVWLVDDVCTTGATLAACARTLRRAGAGRVHAVTVARVLRHP